MARRSLARWGLVPGLLGLSSMGVVTAGCSAVEAAVPGCGAVQRVALVAQSVPTASYVPCLGTLAAGWQSTGFRATKGSTSFSLESDRAAGHPVEIALVPRCDVRGATLGASRAPGVTTYLRLRSISPFYAGELFDVFAGGCVTYGFAFQRGPHIALTEEFEHAVALYPRQQLSLDLRKRLGVTLGP